MKYYFKEPFMLTTHGKDNEIEYVEIPAPTAKILACCELEQEFNKALMFMASNKNEILGDIPTSKKKNDDVNISEQIGYLLAMGNASLIKCYQALKKCIVDSSSKLNGEIRCSSSIYDEIPYIELKGLLGDYIENFINSLR